MKKSNVELVVGIFIVIGIVCVGYLTIKLGNLELFSSNHYAVTADFQSVTGLRTGANVEIAGVQVGRVEKIELDQKTGTAKVTLLLNKGVELSEDTIASIKTAGLIGDKYVGLSLGNSPETLVANDVITETESSVDIESLISKYVFGGADSSSSATKESK